MVVLIIVVITLIILGILFGIEIFKLDYLVNGIDCINMYFQMLLEGYLGIYSINLIETEIHTCKRKGKFWNIPFPEN